MTFTRHEPPYLTDPQIIAFGDSGESAHSASILKSDIFPDQYGKYSLKAGLFVERTAGSNRLLRRATVTEPFATTTGKIDLWQLFKEGDNLEIPEPTVLLTVSALAQGATVLITAGGYSDTFTFTGTVATTTTAAATELAAFINNSATLSRILRAASSVNAVRLFSADGATVQTVTIQTAGTIARNPSDGVMSTRTVVGTILTIDRKDNPGLVTLTSSATTPVPAGVHVGIPAGEILGFINYSLNLDNADRQHVSIVTGACGVYENRLPYFDEDIRRQLPKIKFAKRF